jgi:hypothetical protein
MSLFGNKKRKSRATKKPVSRTNAGWESERQRQAAYAADKSRKGRNIGPIPDVVNPSRKELARLDFEYYLRTYFPQTFYNPWSPDHRKAIELTEQVVLHGGKFADALPRGYGKTSIAERGALWAGSYGHRLFPFIIGADAPAAEAIIDTIKSEIENNPLLFEDFPEICHPVRMLDGVVNRANAQHLDGARTLLGWKGDRIILPTVKGSAASGVIIQAKGITGAMRGKKVMRKDGKPARPDLILLDDPQTDESANSLTQNNKLLKIVRGAVLGMAGLGKKVGVLMPCTTIARGDMVDQLLDRDRNPDWQGIRCSLIKTFPTNEELWEAYRKERRRGLKAEDRGKAGNNFYEANQAALEVGAEVAWHACKGETDISALQYAMNLKLDLGDEAFFSEYQNAPLKPEVQESDTLSVEFIASCTNGRERGQVPDTTTKLVSFVDVQKFVLYWGVLALEDDFSGHIVEYNAWPDQEREWFTCRDAKKTIQDLLGTKSLEETIYQGLDKFCGELLPRKWRRDDGSDIRIDRCLIDANWGESTDIVKKFCRESTYAAQLVPSHGIGVTVKGRPFDQYRAKPGDEIGDHWRRPAANGRQVRHVVYDTNFWKSFLMGRLAVPAGGVGRFTFFGSDPQQHKLIADHLTSEEPVKVEAKGRVGIEWELKNTRPDNHYLDVLTGCCVAGSMLKISLKEREMPAARSAHRVVNVRFDGSTRGRIINA